MTGRDDGLDGGGPNNQYTFIPLPKRNETMRGYYSEKAILRPGDNTHDECGELFFIRRREVHHGFEDLDAGI